MPCNKGIGRKYKRKRDTSAPYLRPKGKQKLETTGRAEEPCNVDSEEKEFSDCDDGFGAVINDEMRRGAIAVTFVGVFDAPPECEWKGKEMEPFLISYGTTRCPMTPAMLLAEY